MMSSDDPKNLGFRNAGGSDLERKMIQARRRRTTFQKYEEACEKRWGNLQSTGPIMAKFKVNREDEDCVDMGDDVSKYNI